MWANRVTFAMHTIVSNVHIFGAYAGDREIRCTGLCCWQGRVVRVTVRKVTLFVVTVYLCFFVTTKYTLLNYRITEQTAKASLSVLEPAIVLVLWELLSCVDQGFVPTDTLL